MANRLLIISFSNLTRDPRVNRQIRFFHDQYEVWTVGCENADLAGVPFQQVSPKRPTFRRMLKMWLLYKFGQFGRSYRYLYRIEPDLIASLSEVRFDAIIANDVSALPLAFEVAKGARILLDAHEYAPAQFEDRPAWRLFLGSWTTHVCAKYLSRCDAMTTVCDGIAEEYQRQFGVRPVVITNAADYVALEPSPVRADQVRMIHHGGASPSRKLELMIEMMNHVDERFTLDLMLVPTYWGEYLAELRERAKGKENIRFRSPVPRPELVSSTNQYDIGLYLLPPTSLNCRYSLPNKFFEFIQARLALAIGPSLEMAKLTRQYDCGVVAEDFEPASMAACLKALTKEQIKHYKTQSHHAARELSSEATMRRFRELVMALL